MNVSNELRAGMGPAGMKYTMSLPSVVASKTLLRTSSGGVSSNTVKLNKSISYKSESHYIYLEKSFI